MLCRGRPVQFAFKGLPYNGLTNWAFDFDTSLKRDSAEEVRYNLRNPNFQLQYQMSVAALLA